MLLGNFFNMYSSKLLQLVFKVLVQLIKHHCTRRRDHGPLLFRLLSTELWFRRFIDAPIISDSDFVSV